MRRKQLYIQYIYTHITHTHTHRGRVNASLAGERGRITKTKMDATIYPQRKEMDKKKKTRRGDLPLDTIFNGIWRLLTPPGMRHEWRYGACNVRVHETYAIRWYKGQQANLERRKHRRCNEGSHCWSRRQEEQNVKWANPLRRDTYLSVPSELELRALHCWDNISRCFSGELPPKPSGEKKGAHTRYVSNYPFYSSHSHTDKSRSSAKIIFLRMWCTRFDVLSHVLHIVCFYPVQWQ